MRTLTGSMARAGGAVPADGATLPIAYIPLVPADIGPLTNVEATVTGWGQRDGSSAGDPPVLYEVAVPIISNADCDAAFDGFITDRMLCAGVPEGGLGPCFGDSGGPLVVFDAARDRTATWVTLPVIVAVKD